MQNKDSQFDPEELVTDSEPVADPGPASTEPDTSAPPRMYKYAAFISYQHNERDAKVARDVQRAIETFRFPKGVGGGSKELGKCFRDEDELAATSSLPNSIKEALNESAALIVICSPEARESMWVDREIREYAALHGPKRIYAVLASGEPDNAFPPAFSDATLSEDEMRAPLAADFRSTSRKKRRAEQTRIIAALANADYDDLVQRLEKRRKKTRVAVAAASLALLVLISALSVFAFSEARNHAIAESKELASRSQLELNAGHRIKAIKTALSALPSSSKELERPLVDEAKEALLDATQYDSYDSCWLPTFCLEMPGNVESFVISPNWGRWSAVIDDQLNLGIFDLSSGARLHLFKLDEEFADLNTLPPDSSLSVEDVQKDESASPLDDWMIAPLGVNRLLVSNRDLPAGIACIDIATGETLWECQCYSVDGVAVSPDRKHVGVLTVERDEAILLSVLDADEGVLVEDYSFEVKEEKDGFSVPKEPAPFVIDNAGNMRFAIGYDSYVLDAGTDVLHYWRGDFRLVSVASGSRLQGFSGPVSLTDEPGEFLELYDAYSKEEEEMDMVGRWLLESCKMQDLVWSDEGSYQIETFSASDDYRKTTSNLNYLGIEGVVSCQGPKVIVRAGNKVMLVSPENGDIVWSREFSSTVLAATAQYSPTEYEMLSIATSDGSLETVMLDAPSVRLGTTKGKIPFISSEIIMGSFDHSCTLALAKPLKPSNEIVVFRQWSRGEGDDSPELTFDELLELAHRIVSANEGSGEHVNLVQYPWDTENEFA